MSFILSLTIDGGIVMAADNTMSVKLNKGWHVSNEYRKLYITSHNMGISCGGDTETKSGISILQLLNQFISNINILTHDTPLKVSQSLLDFVRCFDAESNFTFHLSGYEIKNNIAAPQIIRIRTCKNDITLCNKNPNVPFAAWDAADETPAVFIKNAHKYNFWDSLETATRFINFVFKACSDTIKRIEGAGIIGAKPDILAIYPFSYEWVNLNELGGEK